MSTTNTSPARKTCACGCGDLVSSKSTWLPGHDARAAGRAAEAKVKGDASLVKALPTPALRAKAEALAAKWSAEAAVKAERAAQKVAREAAKASA